MKRLLLAFLLAASVSEAAAADHCVPLWSATVIVEGSGKVISVYINADSRWDAQAALEAQYGAGRVVNLYEEDAC